MAPSADGEMVVRELRLHERARLEQQLRRSWGSATIVSRGRSRDASQLPALVCAAGDELVGLATFEIRGSECELVTIEALRRSQGIGSALLDAVVEQARQRGCRRLMLVTTNDNLAALGFYQRRGLRLCAVHRGAVDEARTLKPEIPLTGENGIPIHDELELEFAITER